jgi:hypothetical protein
VQHYLVGARPAQRDLDRIPIRYADNACRNACHGGVRWNVAYNETHRSDYHVITDADVSKDLRAGPKSNPISQLWTLSIDPITQYISHPKGTFGSNSYIVINDDGPSVIYAQARTDLSPLADLDVRQYLGKHHQYAVERI